MQPTTVTNKNIANGVPKKRAGKSDDDSSAPGSPLELQNLLQALRAMRAGDFSVRMTGEEDGLLGKIADTFNEIVAANQRMAEQIERVGQLVGREGQTRHRVKFGLSSGAWGEIESSVNTLIDDLIWPTKEVTTAVAAVAQGNLLNTVRLEVDGRPLKGEFLEAATIVNTMIKQLSVFTSEVTRVAREVGTEGKLGGQAQVREVTGVWKDLTESVNSMASNLTAQVRNIAEVTIAVADGDLSKKITVDVRGEILQLKEAINTMVDQLRSFASEVTRVAREVGTDGKLGGQALVPGVAGTWKDLTDSVNAMCGNLTDQVRNIAQVTTAVARGDLSRKITVDVRGEILELKDTINTMVDQLNAFASEVTRVAREVGTEGKLGGQAQVPGVAGTWKDLTDSVNFMAGNLTAQVRNIAEVATAIAGGDLSKKITVDVSGEILQLKETLNTMVDQLNAFAGEVTRVAREVGTEGRLGGQASVPGVAGTWKDLTDNVNSMAGNLTAQVRNIAEVTTAVARGDLSRKITVDVKGEILELKNTINTMVDQLNAFASEVTRVAREVGTEGKLGGQAQVPGVAGTWKDLTDNVNFMASNLTAQVRNIAEVATAIANGDLSKKITVDVRGEILQLKETLNTMVEQLRSFAGEVTRVAREVGTEGRLGGQAVVPGVAGTWKDLTDNVNLLAANLTTQVRNIAEVTTAVARGDLSRKITVDVKGEILELKNTINTMVDQLNAFASEVTRVAREVGTEGKLGGQAQVPGVAGTWKDLTDTVNVMAANLTEQVRGIVKVVTAVANGDLKQNLTVKSKGEVAALAETINNMTDTLATFADQVTTVAREVGVEGRLGGQANVPGAAGTWKDLTGNVNLLAANLTTQVRAIAEVATAVTKGDLTRSIQVEARGEVAELKDNINTMIDNLRLTTDRNTEQDWLKTNLAQVHQHAAGPARPRHRRPAAALRADAAGQCAPGRHLPDGERGDCTTLRLLSAYADDGANGHPQRLRLGEGLIGQCAVDKRRMLITDMPDRRRPDRLGAVQGGAAEHHRAAGAVREPGQGGDRARLAQRVHRAADDVPRAAHRQHRHRAQHDRSDDADRRPAQAVAAARRRAADAAEGAAADQRAARAEGAAARRAERRSRAQEPGNRAGAPRARGKGGRAGAHLEVQVRVPCQHVARAAHAAQQHPDPRPAARRQPRRQSHVEAGRVRAHHPRRRHRPAEPDQRHSRPVEDRIRHRHGRGGGDPLLQPARRGRRGRSATRRKRGSSRSTSHLDPDARPQHHHRLQAAAAGAQEPAVERVQVHRAGRRAAQRLGRARRLERRASDPQPGADASSPSKSPTPASAFRRKSRRSSSRRSSRPTPAPAASTAAPASASPSAASWPTCWAAKSSCAAPPGVGSTFTLYLPLTYVGPSDRAHGRRRMPSLPVAGDQRADRAAGARRSSRSPTTAIKIEPGDPILLIVEDDPHYARILVDLARDKGFKVLVAMRGADALELAKQYQPTRGLARRLPARHARLDACSASSSRTR